MNTCILLGLLFNIMYNIGNISMWHTNVFEPEKLSKTSKLTYFSVLKKVATSKLKILYYLNGGSKLSTSEH